MTGFYRDGRCNHAGRWAKGERVEDRGGRGECGQSFVGFLSLRRFRGFALSGRLGEPIGAVACHGPLGRAPFLSLVLR